MHSEPNYPQRDEYLYNFPWSRVSCRAGLAARALVKVPYIFLASTSLHRSRELRANLDLNVLGITQPCDPLMYCKLISYLSRTAIYMVDSEKGRVWMFLKLLVRNHK